MLKGTLRLFMVPFAEGQILVDAWLLVGVVEL